MHIYWTEKLLLKLISAVNTPFMKHFTTSAYALNTTTRSIVQLGETHTFSSLIHEISASVLRLLLYRRIFVPYTILDYSAYLSRWSPFHGLQTTLMWSRELYFTVRKNMVYDIIQKNIVLLISFEFVMKE